MSNNPKSFYNQSNYSGSGSSPIVHKPDEQPPPPPYTPDHGVKSTSDSGSYGSTSRPQQSLQQQSGLLSPSAPPFQDNSPQFISTPPAQQQPQYYNPSPSTPHHQYQPVPTNWDHRRGRSNGDPGCCRHWCKYIIAAFLLWLVLLKFGGFIFSHSSPGGSICSSDDLLWDDMPHNIEFSRNIEVVVEGHVSGGHVVITPLEDRHGGSIKTDITYTPSYLSKRMAFQVDQMSDETTRLVLTMPSRLNSNDECIELNMEIRVPYSADFVHVDVRNVEVSVYPFIKDVANVDIKNANGNIRLDKWTGKQIKLSTSNGNIKVGRLISDDTIYLESTSGTIALDENIEAKSRIDIQNANGAVKTLGSIQADDTVRIETSNGMIHLGSVLADNVDLKTSNSGILVDYIKSKRQVLVQSSNGPISILVAGEKNNQVAISTTNGPVNLHMTNEFEGRFEMITTSAKVTINNEEYIKYSENSDQVKRGDRRGSGNKGDLTIHNTNADIQVFFEDM